MTAYYIDQANGNDNNTGDPTPVFLAGANAQWGADYSHVQVPTGGLTGSLGKLLRLNGAYAYEIVEVVSDTEVRVAHAFPGWYAPLSFAIGGPLKTTSPFQAGYFPLNPGDEVRVAKTPNSDPAGPETMTFTNNSRTVTFDSGRIKIIDQCEADWVAATGDVAVGYYNYYYLQGTQYLQVKPSGAFTTGKLAYKTLPAELDLSDFQGISFALKGENDLLMADYVKVCLCSDATGDVVVDEFVFQTRPMYTSTPWYPITVMRTGGGDLGAAINSIAVYALQDGSNTPYIGFDNFVAVHPIGASGHLCHGCVLGLSDEFPYDHWGLDSFDTDTTLTLTCAFYGPDEVDGAYDVYTRETFNGKQLDLNVSVTSPDPVLHPVVISGGWNLATEGQDGVSIFGAAWHEVYGQPIEPIKFNYRAGIKLQNFMITSVNLLVDYHCDYCQLKDIVLAPGCLGQYSYPQGLLYNASYTYYDTPFLGWKFKNVFQCGGQYGFFYNWMRSIYSGYYRDGQFGFEIDGLFMRSAGHLDLSGFSGLRAKNVESLGSGATQGGIYADGYFEDCLIDGLKIRHPGAYGMDFSAYGGKNLQILNLDSSGATTALIKAGNIDLKLLNPVIAEATFFDSGQRLMRISRINNGGVAGVHIIDTYYGQITSDTGVRHTASGISWKLCPTNADGMPIRMKLAEFALVQGIEVAVSVWMRRSNPGVHGRIFIPGGYLAGIPDEVEATMGSDSANVWRQYTITVTPTADGVVELWVEAQGGTTYSLWVDDLDVV